MSDTIQPHFPYRMAQDEVVAALATDARAGLSVEEVRARLERHGRNELAAEKPVPTVIMEETPLGDRANMISSGRRSDGADMSRRPP